VWLHGQAGSGWCLHREDGIAATARESIDGHTDSPHEATAERGEHLLATIVPAVAEVFTRLATLPIVAARLDF
jgi:hypothetical protein